MAMLVCFLPIVFVVLLFFTLISMGYTDQNVLRNSQAYTYQLVKQVNTDIDSYIINMENIALMVSNSRDVSSWMFDTKNPPEIQKGIENNILAQFQTVMDSRKDVYSIALRSEDGNILVNDGNARLNEYNNISQQGWYREAMKANKGTALSSSHVQNVIQGEYTWVVTVSKTIKDSTTGETGGLFFVDLNYDDIAQLCSNIDLGNKGYVFIIDGKGNILYHPRQQLIYSGAMTERVEEVLSCKENSFQVGEGEDAQFYSISNSKKTGWTVVGVTYNSDLLTNRGRTQALYLILALGLLALAVLVTTVLSKRITRPIKILNDSVMEMEKGRFNKIDMLQIPENEIGSLSRNYNSMSDQIQYLMEENIEEQRQKRKLELQALQSQINPHFLYNTLDSIVWMAEWGKNKEVVMMTSSLAKLFRQSISNEKEVISISQELEHVENYLKIQQMRYKDKLEYEIDADSSLLNKPIVKLVIQPLAENSIYHGVKYLEEKGKISITVSKMEHKIMVSVQDNGPGMSPNMLEHIFEKHKVDYKRNGVGIYNVQARLKLYYGEEYGIFYKSEEGKGTTASIIIPDQERM